MIVEGGSVIILVGGGHAAGKKTVCERIKSTVVANSSSNIEVEILDLDSYVNEEGSRETGPTRFNCSNLLKDVEELESKSKTKKLILIAGLYSLYDKRLRALASMKLFIDCDADTRLARWITQDTLHGDKKLGEILDYYITKARPEFNEFIVQTKEYADVILPNDEETNGISLICDGIQPLFSNTALSKSGKALYPRYGIDSADAPNPLNLQAEAFSGQKDRFYDLS